MITNCKTWIPVLAILILLTGLGDYAFSANEKGSASEKVAVVNGKSINRSDVDAEMSRYEKQMTMMGQTANPEQLSEMKDKVIDGLVDRELLFQESKRLGISSSEAEVTDQIGALKKRFPTEAEFAEALGKMNITEAELKAQISQDMAIKKMIDQEVTGKVTSSNDEAKAFYDGHPDLFKSPEMVRASHILIKVDPQASEADKTKARERITEAQKRIQKGDDFAVVAKEVSECPSSAQGGDLNFFQRGQMVGPFEEVAFSLKPGTVSEIVETQFGYHIIKVTEKKDPGVVAYEEIKERIEQHLKQEKVNTQLAQYVEQLKSKAKIEKFTK